MHELKPSTSRTGPTPTAPVVYLCWAVLQVGCSSESDPGSSAGGAGGADAAVVSDAGPSETGSGSCELGNACVASASCDGEAVGCATWAAPTNLVLSEGEIWGADLFKIGQGIKTFVGRTPLQVPQAANWIATMPPGAAATAIAVGENGTSYVVGSVTQNSHEDLMLAEYPYATQNTSSPTLLWKAGGTGHDRFDDVAVLPDGDVLAVGSITSGVDLGAGPKTTRGEHDSVVIRFTASGQIRDSLVFGSEGHDVATSVAVTKDGQFLVTGTFSGTIEVAGHSVASLGGSDVFVAKLDAGLKIEWLRRFGSSGVEGSPRVAWTTQPILAMTTQGKPPTCEDHDANTRLAVIGLSPSGDLRWRRTSEGAQFALHKLRASSGGRLWITGAVSGPASFGGAVFESVDAQDGFALLVDSGGCPLWHRTVGSVGGPEAVTEILDLGAGQVLFGGRFASSMDLGSGSIQVTQGGFLARMPHPVP